MRFVIAFLAACVALSCRVEAQTAQCNLWQYVFYLHVAGETAYTIGTPDQCGTLIFQNTGAETITLPQPGTTFFPPGWFTKLYAQGSGGITAARANTTYTVNGGATVSKTQGGAMVCVTDGNSWWCV